MSGKLDLSQLERSAYVYVRQSTAAQVMEHRESTERQYALAERAEALGWPPEAVEIIDEDQGLSGKTTEGRSGFARLADAVAHGKAGAILAVEVSRLARSSVDWQRLMTLCAVANVAVIDEQSIYDPNNHDDKLLLDLKGTMSDAELHWLGLRLYGARLNKARKGKLRVPPPTGYIWTEQGFVMDPDEAVRRAIRLIFARFSIETSAWAVVRWARETGFLCPLRRTWADGTSELTWKPLGVSRLSSILHNPVYAGAYAYGRCREHNSLVDGAVHRVRRVQRDPGEWLVCIRDAHEGYIPWETWLSNREKLRQNRSRLQLQTPGAPREGLALLAGMLVCGRCGRRMRPMYDQRGQRRSWRYLCVGERDRGQTTCWSVAGEPIDAAVEELFLESFVPGELELCLAVEREVQHQSAVITEQWRARIEQAEYEARHAERRYKAVDPDNRVVARTLEREWELRLRELDDVRRRLEEAKRAHVVELSRDDRQRIRALAQDLPAVWKAPTTRLSERKGMLRLVIEAITVTPIDAPQRVTRLQVQWQSGAISELMVSRPDRKERRRTSPEAVRRIRQLAGEGVPDDQIAACLDREQIPTGAGQSWTIWAVRWVRQRHEIRKVAPDEPRRRPLPDRHPDGRYSITGASRRFGVSKSVVRGWIRRRLVCATRDDFEQHRQVWWIEVDDQTAAMLEKAAAQTRSRIKQRTPSKPTQ